MFSIFSGGFCIFCICISLHGLSSFQKLRNNWTNLYSIAHLFAVSKRTVWWCVTEFCAAVNELLHTNLLSLPDAATMGEMKLNDDQAPLTSVQSTRRWGRRALAPLQRSFISSTARRSQSGNRNANQHGYSLTCCGLNCQRKSSNGCLRTETFWKCTGI